MSLRPTLAILGLVLVMSAVSSGCIGSAASPGSSPAPSAIASNAGGSGETGIRGTALAGPVCPVETVPPDPDCAPRPVVGATVLVRNAEGALVAQGVTDSEGVFFVELPAGDYTVEPNAVEGLPGVAPPQDVHVIASKVASIQLEYDTGIR